MDAVFIAGLVRVLGSSQAVTMPLTLYQRDACHLCDAAIEVLAAARALPAPLAPWIIGYVDLLAFAALALGSLAGIRLAAPLIPRIPDRLHARVYVALLALVLLSMLLA